MNSAILTMYAKLSALGMQFFFISIGILGIGFLIGFHEFGHFLFCKLFDIATPTFSIGMGPQVLKKKLGQTEFALSAIPMGGYVEIEPASFNKKPWIQKMLVIAGGILFNMLFAYVALSALFYAGMPQTALTYPYHATTVIEQVRDDSPAQTIGLVNGDTIVGYNGISSPRSTELIEYIRSHPAQSITLSIIKDNASEATTQTVTIGSKELPCAVGQPAQTIGYLGIEFAMRRYGFIQSIHHGISTTHTLMMQVLAGFKAIVAKKAVGQLGGPLMVIFQTVKGAEKGALFFLFLLAFISVNLAVLNILPLPIMDGGQALLITIESIKGSPLSETIKTYIQYASWLLVLALVITLSIKDMIFFCK
ncbi:MAG: M50 family metallopeptidase [Candidatus Babeliales bacterium]